jgi:DNA polymerase elongation subunit (family B)
LNLHIDETIQDVRKSVKSNVAISAAVTAYARMLMIDFKTNTNFNIYYSDTDSIFIDKPLDFNQIGKDLGLMKNELQGKSVDNVITRAMFLGNKKYIYEYVDFKNGETKIVSV